MKYIKLPLFCLASAVLLGAAAVSVIMDERRKRTSRFTIWLGEMTDRLALWMWPGEPLPEAFGICRLRRING